RELRELMLDHLERWPDLEPLNEAEQRVLRKALAKQPELRFASCSAFVKALEEACKHGGLVEDVALTRPAPGPSNQTTSGRQWVIWTLLAIALLLLSLTAMLWWWKVSGS